MMPRTDRRGQTWLESYDDAMWLIASEPDARGLVLIASLETGELDKVHYGVFEDPVVGWERVG